jgi:hypothetical protein
MAKVRRKYWREQPWMCWTCGYMMDTASPAASKTSAAPEEGDASMCLNCGEPYMRKDDRWSPMTAEQLLTLPPEMRRKLAIGRSVAVRPFTGRDLSKRGGHA